jgi:RNA polymerase sigma-70 factor (ECF subfamily)
MATVARSEILSRIRERIVIFGTSRIGRDGAEDVAQDTLMLLERKYAGLDEEVDLLRIAIRTMDLKMKSWRRGVVRKRLADTPVDEMPLSDSRPGAAEELEKKQFKQRFETALAKLGDRCRRLLYLKLEGKRLPEIRQMLGADNMQQLYTWDFRCRQDLKKWLTEGGISA